MEPIDKIKQVESIDKFELFSIVYLCECLNDNSLQVRYSAYQKLRSSNLDLKILSARQIDLIDLGVLLNPDDVVWSVYQSGLDYDDNHYDICDLSGDSDENIYGEEIDNYDFSGGGIACKFISTHVDRESAEVIAHETIKAIIRRDEYPYSGYYDLSIDIEEISQQDIYNWANQYTIADLPQPENLRKIKRDWRVENYRDESSWQDEDRLRNYAMAILQKLSVDEHYELIDKIYGSLFGRLAYIRKETVRETIYFKP